MMQQKLKPFLSLILILFGMLDFTTAQDVVINEFLSSNVTDYPEMYDFVDYDDWIELYNPGPNVVDLSSYFLSDNINDLLKWKIPDGTTLAPGAYQLIWADDFNTGPGNVYQRLAWPWSSYTTRHYHANFKLSKSGEEVVLSRAVQNNSLTLIPTGSIWKYLDDGSNQGEVWTQLDFIDQTWSQGAAELGYGDGDETTLLSYGPDGNNKYTTTYFRKSFNVDAAGDLQTLFMRLKRDDGAVVYLNGTEILRSNMPSGTINYTTLAASAVSSGDESAFFEYDLSATELLTGQNVVAVEIHQISGTSSDISFDLELSAMGYSDVELVDQVVFGSQLSDVSTGRDINGDWQSFGEPSPGSANSDDPATVLEGAGALTSSLESGFYAGSQVLSLSSNVPDGTIYYTLDGAKPGSGSQVYTTPLQIDGTTVLRARVLRPGYLPGEILTRSFLIDEPSDIPTASLIAEPRTLWDSDLGIYENEYKQREIPVTLEYYSPEEERQFVVNAGARLGGLNIWTKPQKPFTIYMRNKFGDDLIRHQIFANKPIADFSRIVLRNGGDDWEETLIRDPMTESLVQGMMDCGYMAYQPTALFLNGAYWGIHNIREKFDSGYFAQNYGVDPANYDHLEYGSTSAGTQLMAVEGDLLAYNAMLSFIQNSALNQPDIYAQVQQMMNVDGFIDHLVMTLYSANTSWGHNREWWRARSENARWNWLIVDVDRGFNPDNLNTNLLDNLMGEYILFNALLPCQAFEERFIQRAAAHINNTFKYERIAEIVDSLSTLIAAEMPRHIERWGSQGSVSSMGYWSDQLDEILQYAEFRPPVLFSQFENELNLSGEVALTMTVDPVGSGRILANEVPVLYPGTAQLFFRDTPLTLRAQPAPGYQFVGWQGGSDSLEISIECTGDGNYTAVFQASGEMLLPPIINENLVLENDQPFVIANDLFIEAGASLTLNEGVVLRMPPDGNIVVEGQLMIQGSAENPVQILPNTAVGTFAWGGISFSNATDTSRISHLVLRGATRGADPLLHRGAISSINSHLVLNHVDLSQVLFPIFIQGGSSVVSYCSISTDAICDFINVKYGETVIDHCSFFGSDAYDTDAIDLDGVVGGIVSNNHIYNFSGFNSDGIDIGEGSQDILISSNRIYHSHDKGVSIGQRSSVTVDRNLIVGCAMGVAVKDSSTALISNNTFFRNDTSVACYVKNEGEGGGFAEVVNSILADNRAAALFADELSNITCNYSLSDTDILEGTGNLFDDALFLAENDYNLELDPDSPCFDSGDPTFPLDQDGSHADMGAYYSYSPADFPFEIPLQTIELLRINEFLASNETVNMDEAGEYDDWLELYNPTAEGIDLAGLYLTDNPDNLNKWSLPSAGSFIEPGGYLLIWCDEDGTQGPLHANFKLSGSGEFLALVASDGLSILDSTSYGAQVVDISYGRITDGAEGWSAMTPTPAGSNVLLLVGEDEVLPDQVRLLQNFPNPFNPVTTIRYDLPEISIVSIRIVDLRGQHVKTLVEGNQPAGYGSILWNSRDDEGRSVPAGLYFYTLKTDSFRQTRKLIVLK